MAVAEVRTLQPNETAEIPGTILVLEGNINIDKNNYGSNDIAYDLTIDGLRPKKLIAADEQVRVNMLFSADFKF